MTGERVIEAARRVADDVLFPAAPATDAADAVPRAHLDLLAEAGLYGMAGPVASGGLDADVATACSVIEILAGACLANTFSVSSGASAASARDRPALP